MFVQACVASTGNGLFLGPNVVCVYVCKKESWHICVITWDWMCQVISRSVKESREERQAT